MPIKVSGIGLAISASATLNDLTDVTITSVQNGQYLVYNSTFSDWRNVTLSAATLGANSFTGTQTIGTGSANYMALAGAAAASSPTITALGSDTNVGISIISKGSGVITLAGAIALNGAVRTTVQAMAALDVDCSTGSTFSKTINGASTFTFSNPPATGNDYVFKLILTHTSGAITWPAAAIWPGGTAPTLTSGKVHLFYFATNNAGATWRGNVLADYAS